MKMASNSLPDSVHVCRIDECTDTDYAVIEKHLLKHSTSQTCLLELAPSCSLTNPSQHGYCRGKVQPSDIVQFERSVMGMGAAPLQYSQDVGVASEVMWSKLVDTPRSIE